MVENPCKKIKSSEHSYKNINKVKKENDNDVFVKERDNKIFFGKRNTSEWLHSKFNDLCGNFKIFKNKENEENEKKKRKKKKREKVLTEDSSNSDTNVIGVGRKRNKRTFEQITETTENDKQETVNFRPPFGYISLLKSLLLIYEFYANQEQNCAQEKNGLLHYLKDKKTK